MKVPIVLTAFGTTTSAQQSDAFLDEHIRAAFPEHEVHWAFSSRMVRDFSRQHHSRKGKGPDDFYRSCWWQEVISKKIWPGRKIPGKRCWKQPD